MTVIAPERHEAPTAPATMRAARVLGFDRPLSLEEIVLPEPGPEEVLVRIEASGLCHTDIHAAHGDWPVKPHAAVRARSRRRRHRRRGRAPP